MSAAIFSTCPECSKIYAIGLGRRLCPECTTALLDRVSLVEDAVEREGKRTIADIATYTGLTEREVRQALREARLLGRLVEVDEKCARCGRAPATAGMTLCAKCRAEMYNALELVTREMASQVPREESRRQGTASSIAALLEEKKGKRGIDLSHLPQYRMG